MKIVLNPLPRHGAPVAIGEIVNDSFDKRVCSNVLLRFEKSPPARHAFLQQAPKAARLGSSDAVLATIGEATTRLHSSALKLALLAMLISRSLKPRTRAPHL